MFKKIGKAYEELSDQQKRQAYDRERIERGQAKTPQKAPPTGSAPQRASSKSQPRGQTAHNSPSGRTSSRGAGSTRPQPKAGQRQTPPSGRASHGAGAPRGPAPQRASPKSHPPGQTREQGPTRSPPQRGPQPKATSAGQTQPPRSQGSQERPTPQTPPSGWASHGAGAPPGPAPQPEGRPGSSAYRGGSTRMTPPPEGPSPERPQWAQRAQDRPPQQEPPSAAQCPVIEKYKLVKKEPGGTAAPSGSEPVQVVLNCGFFIDHVLSASDADASEEGYADPVPDGE
ncbi:unnamed protein product, partial [Amoebophrya sp. A25]|eukprot:GSA25T00017794001.1